jgi:hypothetical protein
MGSKHYEMGIGGGWERGRGGGKVVTIIRLKDTELKIGAAA